MSFFEKKYNPKPQPDAGFKPIPAQPARGDRTIAERVEAPPPKPNYRRTSSHVVDRIPRGCLFKVGRCWFDLDGFWCRPVADGQVIVTRGCPKAISAKLTAVQKANLHRVRLNARRAGIR